MKNEDFELSQAKVCVLPGGQVRHLTTRWKNLKSQIEGRIRRYDLKYGPGDLEVVIFRTYRAHLEKLALKVNN